MKTKKAIHNPAPFLTGLFIAQKQSAAIIQNRGQALVAFRACPLFFWDHDEF